MRAVVDTNILVSALLTPGGISAQLILAIRRQTLIPVVSQDILAEYTEVLNRPRFGFANDRVTSLLEDMKGLALFLRPQTVPLQDLLDGALVLQLHHQGLGIGGQRRHGSDLAN